MQAYCDEEGFDYNTVCRTKNIRQQQAVFARCAMKVRITTQGEDRRGTRFSICWPLVLVSAYQAGHGGALPSWQGWTGALLGPLHRIRVI